MHECTQERGVVSTLASRRQALATSAAFDAVLQPSQSFVNLQLRDKLKSFTGSSINFTPNFLYCKRDLNLNETTRLDRGDMYCMCRLCVSHTMLFESRVFPHQITGQRIEVVVGFTDFKAPRGN